MTTGNPHRGEITVHLYVDETDEKPRPLKLRPGFQAWCNVEQRLKKPLVLLAGDFGNMSLNSIAVALQELLTAGGHPFGMDEIGRIIELNGVDMFTAPGGPLFGPLESIVGGNRRPLYEPAPDQEAQGAPGKPQAKRQKDSRGSASQTSASAS